MDDVGEDACPSLEEIAAACESIRSQWTKAEASRRSRGYCTPQQAGELSQRPAWTPPLIRVAELGVGVVN